MFTKLPKKFLIKKSNAGVAQLAERELPKLEVASSTLVARCGLNY